MAKFRYVNTSIWDDEWFTGLDALEQHLFMYLLTNAYSNISGVYQIPLRKIAFETGMDQEKVKKILARFDADGKVFYDLGWLIMKNWQKHQMLNPNQAQAVVSAVNAAPEWLKILLFDVNSPYCIAFETLTKGLIRLENGSLILRTKEKEKGNSNNSLSGIKKDKKAERNPLEGDSPASKNETDPDDPWVGRV